MAIAVETNQNSNLTPSPNREDGSLWPFALLVGEDTVYADTLTELIGNIIPGYADFAKDGEGNVLAFLARVDSASSIAAQSQSIVLASATSAGEFDLEQQSEANLTALLTPRGLGLIDGEEFDYIWSGPVPLVLLTTDFEPFTAMPTIDGHVQYFDPSTERTYLAALAEFGFVELFINASI